MQFGISQIYIAGLDGYDPSYIPQNNAYKNDMIKDETVIIKNNNISRFLREYTQNTKVVYSTPQKFINY